MLGSTPWCELSLAPCPVPSVVVGGVVLGGPGIQRDFREGVTIEISYNDCFTLSKTPSEVFLRRLFLLYKFQYLVLASTHLYDTMYEYRTVYTV